MPLQMRKTFQRGFFSNCWSFINVRSLCSDDIYCCAVWHPRVALVSCIGAKRARSQFKSRATRRALHVSAFGARFAFGFSPTAFPGSAFDIRFAS